MQKIRSLVLAAGLLASIVTGAVILPLSQSAAPALASTGIFHEEGASTPSVALTLNFAKIEM
jgi:hypothetical protein